MPPTANNDNIPLSAANFPDLAARRAWLATLPATAKPVLAWPTAERLSRLQSPAAAAALLRYADLDRPTRLVAANDNSEPLDTECRLEFRPSVTELLAAADEDLVLTFASRAEANSGWRIAAMDDRPVGFIGRATTILGALRFQRGALTSWGATRRGKALKPVDRRRAPKGSAAPARSAASIRELLPANSNTPIARGAGWLGGITRPRGNSSRPDLGEAEAAMELERNARRDAVRLALGLLHARVLDLAVGDATAREIGAALGYQGKRAERRAITAINEALEKFQEIAA